ncbi:hypothetical protein OCS_05368 [Ophiocordyceps sinensis CO18]|nr:hypothetical protein OCS_05368 [Ophiocordyceps sinensis CO18]
MLERTQDPADLALLDKLIASEPDYVRAKVDPSKGFDGAYDQIEDDILYVKMDDDIVYIEDTALPAMVHTKATRPDLFVVAANVVNQPLISWIHWNLGVVKPYLPELNGTPASHDGPVDWRASRLPSWEGPDDFSADEWESQDRQKHRWLPRRAKTDHVLDNTPISKTTYDASGPGWFRWQVGAQEHYSLLEHLENNEMWRYRYHLWDFQYLRVGIQCIAIMGSDINAAKPISPDDEQHFAVTMPEKLGRHAVTDGRGVVAHFSFSAQSKEGAGMRTTDILERYRAYAKEKACKGPMLWTPEEEEGRGP